MALLTEIKQVITHPKYEQNFDRPKFSTKLVNTLRILLIQFGLAIILGIILSIVLAAVNYDLSNNEVDIAIKTLPVPLIIFLTVIFAPLTEEATFRLSLKYSPFRLGFAFGFIFLTLLNLLETVHIYTISYIRVGLGLTDPFAFALVYITFGLTIGLLVGVVIKAFTKQGFMEKLYRKYFAVIFYVSVITFGTLHITNYAGFEKIILLLPIVVAPQLVIGLFLAFVRMRYGFGWGVLLHSMHNGITVLPAVLFKMGSPALTNSLGKVDVIPQYTTTDILIIATILIFYGILLISVLIVAIHAIVEIFQARKKNTIKN